MYILKQMNYQETKEFWKSILIKIIEEDHCMV